MRRMGRKPSLLLPLLALALLLGLAVGAHPMGRSAATAAPVAGEGDRIAATGDLILQPGDVVEHNASALLGRVEVPAGAEVKHDVIAPNGEVIIGGKVGHDVTALNGDITLLSTAEIGNDVKAVNGRVTREPGATVGGAVTMTTEETPPEEGSGIVGFVLRLLFNIVLGVVFVAAGTLVVLAWPRQTGRVVAVLEGSPKAAVGVGLVTSIFILPVAALLSGLLVITLIGIVLLPVLWIGLFVAWLFGMVVVGLWVGRRVSDSGHLPAARGSLLLTAAVGLALVALTLTLLAAVLPLLGWLLIYFLGFLGSGAAILSRLGVQAGGRHGAGAPRHTHPLSPPPAWPPSDRQAS
jgi:hypothetical protein